MTFQLRHPSFQTQPIKQRVITRRPELLGVGATSKQALGMELGEWGKVGQKHDKTRFKAYTPVVMKNKKTGETVTEEELMLKLKEQQDQKLVMVDQETRKTERRLEYRAPKPSRRDGYEGDSRRDTRRDRERDYEERGNRSSRRERSASVNSRRRHRYDDSDQDRRERKRPDRSTSANRRKKRDDASDYDRQIRKRRDRSRSEDRGKRRDDDFKRRDRPEKRDQILDRRDRNYDRREKDRRYRDR